MALTLESDSMSALAEAQRYQERCFQEWRHWSTMLRLAIDNRVAFFPTDNVLFTRVVDRVADKVKSATIRYLNAGIRVRNLQRRIKREQR